jgi:hypothetical protein
MKKGKERINYLKKIGLSEPIIQMAQGEILHPFFESAYEEPNYIYEMKNIPDNITPLWEFESFQTVVLEENSHIFFVQFNLDDLEATFKIIGYTEQAALARLFLDNIELTNLENDELIKQVTEASKCTGFKHSEEFINLLKWYDSDLENYFERFQIFQEKVDW